jgi:predicted  nucleic acid-binding Zn-ribbon protein
MLNLKTILNIKAAHEELSRLEAEGVRLRADIAVKDTEIAAAKAEISRLTCERTAEQSALESKLSESNAENTRLTSEVAALKAAAASAATRAAEILAAQGVDPNALPPQQTAPVETAEQLATQIRTETDPAKRATLFAKLQKLWDQPKH